MIQHEFAMTACIVAMLTTPPAHAQLERVRVADDQRGFVLTPSGKAFVPHGFNYDHDEKGRLIEDYWDAEWAKVVEDFHEMRDLGANVARIHLQFGRFMKGPETPNDQALDRLGKLLELAAGDSLHVDLTGLGCYHKADVPPWYDSLDEKQRWAAQAVFWRAVAERAACSPAVFCYDLMNEPVVPGGRREGRDWLGGAFGGKHFVQFLSLDQADRPRHEVAEAWVKTLVAAIREKDQRALITVGLVDWSLDRPGKLYSGTPPETLAKQLDFLCVHLYPAPQKLNEEMETLKAFAVGKPVVIEETFPLKCGIADFGRFVERSRTFAAGWVGFYWGKTPEECRKGGTIADAMMLGWLDFFQKTKW